MLTVSAYDKAFALKGLVGGILRCEVTTRHLAPGTGSFTITRDNPRWADLLTPGSRVVCRWDGAQIMSGRVTGKAGSSGNAGSSWTFEVVDDYAEILGLLGWPVPGASHTGQIAAYDVRTGPAETVLKALVTANATRLSLPLSVATDLGRGVGISTSHRFHPILDRMPLETMGFAPTVTQASSGLVVDGYETAVYPFVLRSPVVRSWTVDYTAPAVTRVIAGNQGEGSARVFRVLSDSARESLWGMKREVFLDARDTEDVAEIDQRMAEALVEGAAKAGANVILADGGHFRVGVGYRLGDQVSVQLDPGLPVLTDLVREVRYTAAEGGRATPVVGELVVPESLIPRALAALKKQVQTMSRS